MNRIRINRNNIYEIEVNDAGEKIEFDLLDVDLPFKFQRALDGVKKAKAELEAKIAVISKKEDHKGKNDIMSANELAICKARKEAYAAMRVAMDEFLGKGGCQKIFGDTNYLYMFDDLFDELERKGEDGLSHLDRMQLTAEGVKNRIEQKYGEEAAEDVL